MAELSTHAPLVRGRGAGGRGKGSRSVQRKGEAQQATAAGLDLLRVLGWLVLHDTAVPDDPDVTIDHVLAGPSGVYVVNTVGWSGPVAVHEGVLTVGGTNRHEALADVAAAADLVRRLLGAIPVAPLLCFERLESVTGVAGDVALCASENILDLLTSQPEILDPAAVARASRSLSAAFRPVALSHLREVESSSGRARPASGPSLDELVRARSDEPAADAARMESLENLMGGSAPSGPPAPSVTAVTGVTASTEESKRHRFGLRRGPKKQVAQEESEAAELIDAVADVETPAQVDAPSEVATEATSAAARSSDAFAVGDAGAALWLSLTDAVDEVAAPAADQQDAVDVEAALAEAEAGERAEREAEESRLREEQEARERAEQAAEEARRREADEARKRAAQEARELLERETRELAEREEQERLERDRLEQEAREQAEREEQARLEQEARELAEREEQERLEQEARELAEREARELAAREEQARLEQEARELAERAEQERLEQEARELAEREEKARLEQEARELAERAEQERAEQEARELAEREEQERLEQEAWERAERERAEEAAARAAWEARLHAGREARAREIDLASAGDGLAASVAAGHPEVRRAEVLQPASLARHVVPEAIEPEIGPATVEAIADRAEVAEPEVAEPEVAEPETVESQAVTPAFTPLTFEPEPAAEDWEPQVVVPSARRTDAGFDTAVNTGDVGTDSALDRATADAPALVVASRRRRRAVGHGLSRHALVQVAVAAVLIAGVIVGGPRIGDVVAWGHGLFAQQSPTTVGTTVTLEATTYHPAGTAVAGTPVPAQAQAGAGAAKGEHLVAVPLRIRNDGLTRWDVPVAAEAALVDALGVSHPVARTVKAVKGYPLLPGLTKVAPGAEVTGYVVFSVPDGRDLRSISLGLGKAGDDTVTWQVSP